MDKAEQVIFEFMHEHGICKCEKSSQPDLRAEGVQCHAQDWSKDLSNHLNMSGVLR